VFTTFRHYALPLTAAITLAGCASGAKKNEEALAEALPTNSSGFRDILNYPGNVTCGKYIDRDYQGLPELKPFVVVDTEANMRPTELDIAIFCTDSSKESLNRELKIDFDAQRASIQAVIDDFIFLDQPLRAYEVDNQYFPWTQQGLQALISPSPYGNPPINFPEQGYISKIPVDPWGNDYVYKCDAFAGVRVMYKLRSLGADGKIGGEGENADIKYSHMKYYTHVADL
jgi:type II secretion system protein G